MAHASDHEADPRATTQALTALLGAANDTIPATASTCQGAHGQAGPLRVKDLLALRLGYLYAGQNIIVGSCTGGRCKLSITHAAGEDVASAVIHFRVRRGKAVASSLRCEITP